MVITLILLGWLPSAHIVLPIRCRERDKAMADKLEAEGVDFIQFAWREWLQL